jgi:hypothetical protein
MAPKLTAQELLAQIEQTAKDADVFKALWLDSFPPNLPLPADWEIKNALRRLALADLAEGIKSYLVILSDENAKPTSKNALSYICGTAWAIKEKENPDQTFHPTARRIRNAQLNPESEAFAKATPMSGRRPWPGRLPGKKPKGRNDDLVGATGLGLQSDTGHGQAGPYGMGRASSRWQ